MTELSGFTGTTAYHSTGFRKLRVTDGVHFLRERAKCYWLIDAIESHQIATRVGQEEFQVWELAVLGDRSATLECRCDTGAPVLVRQRFRWVDFPLPKLVLWVVREVVLLPSEY